MGSAVPKQFLEIGEKPILLRTLERTRFLAPEANLILVLPDGQRATWQEICNNFHCNIPHLLAVGGKTRFHSVKNGLALIHDMEGLTAIHDGVRPFVSARLLTQLTMTAKQHGNAIPAVPVDESMRRIKKTGTMIVNRSQYVLIQTPQVFKTTTILKSYQLSFSQRFTDDASVVEHSGEKIILVEGSKENIKITSPFDMIVAEAILQNEKMSD
jgi:2-C-methyl-D-erythritol 4-phosphate cytidylyltransferase